MSANACSCGGHLRDAAINHALLEPLCGLKGSFEGSVPGFRCDSCGEETFSGATIERMLLTVAQIVLTQPRILTGDEARFLRKALLGLTQDRLADRMGINKTTVADWERGERPLSKEHDYELRGIAVAAVLLQFRPPFLHRVESVVRQLGEVLAAPRLEGPPRKGKPYLIPASHLVPA